MTLLFVPLIEGGSEAKVGLYLFKVFLGFIAAALILPLTTVDLWLGRADDVSQND